MSRTALFPSAKVKIGTTAFAGTVGRFDLVQSKHVERAGQASRNLPERLERLDIIVIFQSVIFHYPKNRRHKSRKNRKKGKIFSNINKHTIYQIVARFIPVISQQKRDFKLAAKKKLEYRSISDINWEALKFCFSGALTSVRTIKTPTSSVLCFRGVSFQNSGGYCFRLSLLAPGVLIDPPLKVEASELRFEVEFGRRGN